MNMGELTSKIKAAAAAALTVNCVLQFEVYVGMFEGKYKTSYQYHSKDFIEELITMKSKLCPLAKVYIKAKNKLNS